LICDCLARNWEVVYIHEEVYAEMQLSAKRYSDVLIFAVMCEVSILAWPVGGNLSENSTCLKPNFHQQQFVVLSIGLPLLVRRSNKWLPRDPVNTKQLSCLKL